MTTPIPLDVLYAACRELEAATDATMLKDISVNYITNTGVPEYYCEGLLLSPIAVRRILNDCLWEAVRGWAQVWQWDRNGIIVWPHAHGVRSLGIHPDLPAAARGIVEFERGRKEKV